MRITETWIGPSPIYIFIFCHLTSSVFFFPCSEMILFFIFYFYFVHQNDIILFAFINASFYHFFLLVAKMSFSLFPPFPGFNLSQCNEIACSSLAIGKFHCNVSIDRSNNPKGPRPFFLFHTHSIYGPFNLFIFSAIMHKMYSYLW